MEKVIETPGYMHKRVSRNTLVKTQTCEQCINFLGGESQMAASNISRNILKIFDCK